VVDIWQSTFRRLLSDLDRPIAVATPMSQFAYYRRMRAESDGTHSPSMRRVWRAILASAVGLQDKANDLHALPRLQ
jgi:hypothetical protein